MNYTEYLELNYEEMVSTLQEVIRIRSVAEPPCIDSEGTRYPFGKGIDDALQKVLCCGQEMGFDAVNLNHYGGYLEWKSEKNPDSAKTFVIAGHLDVVPEGPGWTKDPFSADIEDGWMFGRGTTDDKGPVIASLYAMKALKDAGLSPKMNIRLFLGLDEETGSESVRRYTEEEGMPDYGITPDGDFPLTNGEMGILIFDFAQKLRKHTTKDGLVLTKLRGGEAPNIVPGTARAVVAASKSEMYGKIRELAAAFTQETGYEVRTKRAGSSLAIEVTGKTAHGATPECGLNAISILMAFLERLQFAGEEVNDFIHYYNEYIGFHVHGEALGCDLSDEPSGPLVFNVGMAEISEDAAFVTVNIRYPVTKTAAEVYSIIEKSMEGTNIGLLKKVDEPPVYFEEENPFVQTLLEVYRNNTNDNVSSPHVDRGGTYAKELQNTLAFGAQFPDDEDRMHQADEQLSLDRFRLMTKIYADMLARICF